MTLEKSNVSSGHLLLLSTASVMSARARRISLRVQITVCKSMPHTPSLFLA